MEFRVEEIAPCRKRVTVTVPGERVREEFDTQYREISKEVRLPGFRPGHAPRRILEARFGKHVGNEVKQKIVEAAMTRMLEEKAVVPLSAPKVDVETATVAADTPFEFTFEVTTRPEFTLPEWKGREVKVPPLAVTDADVEEGVTALRRSEGVLVPAPDGLRADDVAVVEWSARDDDTALDGGEGAYYRLGSGVLEGFAVDGLDDALRGASDGATATVRGRAAPDDPRTPLAGREFTVTVRVEAAKRFEPAPLDAEFLKRHDFDDVEELRRDVRRRVLRARERQRDRLAEDRLVDGLVEATSIALPEEVVEGAVGDWAERRRVEAQAEGLDEDALTKELTASREEVRARVEADLKRHFVQDRIAEATEVKVAEQEVVGAVEQIARESGRSAGEVIAHFEQNPSRLAELRTHLRHQKAREALRRAAVVVEEAAAPSAPEPAPKKRK